MPLKNILVPLDGSLLSVRTLRYAAEVARAAGASLTLVRTANAHPRLHLLGLTHLLPGDASRDLNTHAYRLRAQGLMVDTALAPGEPAQALITEIKRRQPDLVVMSTRHRSGINRLVHGSVTDTVVSQAGCPVMLVRARAEAGMSAAPRLTGKQVLVPLDGSRFAEAALPVAVHFARTLGSELLLVQAIVPMNPLPLDLQLWVPSDLDQALRLADAEDAATEYLNGVTFRLSQRVKSLRVTSLVRIGLRTEVIRDLSMAAGPLESPVGLVVVATHGRTGLSRAILGNEAEAVAVRDDLPVVLIRPQIGVPARAPTAEVEVEVAHSTPSDRTTHLHLMHAS